MVHDGRVTPYVWGGLGMTLKKFMLVGPCDFEDNEGSPPCTLRRLPQALLFSLARGQSEWFGWVLPVRLKVLIGEGRYG